MYILSLCVCVLQSLAIDNTKLRDSEKKLIKEKIKLTRTCKVREIVNFQIHFCLCMHRVCVSDAGGGEEQGRRQAQDRADTERLY